MGEASDAANDWKTSHRVNYTFEYTPDCDLVVISRDGVPHAIMPAHIFEGLRTRPDAFKAK